MKLNADLYDAGRDSLEAPRVVAVGELLWDLLPGGPRMGGAAANFIYHTHALGADARLVSRVGCDALGAQLLGEIGALGLPAGGIQSDPDKETGTVAVELQDDGQPVFTIRGDVAWDNIRMTDAAESLVSTARAVYFGSLAQRSPASRAAIRALVECAPHDALRVFDANLRQDFYSCEVLHDSLCLANVVKISDAELEVLTELLSLRGTQEEKLAELAARYDLALAACTLGGKGSIIYDGRGWSRHRGVAVSVQDTVGAGDSFAAAVTMGLLHNLEIGEISDLANAVAAHVASMEGAMPPMPLHFRETLRIHAGEVCHA